MRVWTSIYRLSMIRDACLKFENVMSEDTLFNLDAYNKADVITFINSADYCYRMGNHSSITRSFSNTTLNKYSEFLTKLYEKSLSEKKTGMFGKS